MPKKRSKQNQLPILRPNAAGIDIGAEEIFVAVPSDRASVIEQGMPDIFAFFNAHTKAASH